MGAACGDDSGDLHTYLDGAAWEVAGGALDRGPWLTLAVHSPMGDAGTGGRREHSPYAEIWARKPDGR